MPINNDEGLSPAGNTGLSFALNTAGQVGGGLFSLIGAKKRARKSYKRSIKFWNKQNEYNHPLAQMARLKEAGLNPNLVYGGSSGSVSGDAGSYPNVKQADMPDMRMDLNIDPMQKLLQYADIKQKNVVTDNLKRQGEMQMMDMVLKGILTESKLVDLQKAGINLDILRETKQYNIDIVEKTLESLNSKLFTESLTQDAKSEEMRQKAEIFAIEAKTAQTLSSIKEVELWMKEREKQWMVLGVDLSDPAWQYWIAKAFVDNNVGGIIKDWFEKTKVGKRILKQ